MSRKRMFIPQWDGPLAVWAIRYCQINAWRTAPDYEVDDLLQEARIVFLKCERKYAIRVTQPAHFMRLFQISLTNRINTLSNRRTCRHKHYAKLRQSGEPTTLGEFAEADVRDLMESVRSDPIAKLVRQLLATETPKRRRVKSCNGQIRREQMNKFLARVMDIPEKSVVTTIKNWINGNFSASLEND